MTNGDWATVECHPRARDKQEAIEKSLALWYLDSGSEYKVVSVTEEMEEADGDRNDGG